jgi:predicted metal-binding protein
LTCRHYPIFFRAFATPDKSAKVANRITPRPTMNATKKTPTFEPTKWNSLFLVCKQCRKRGNGPQEKAKKLLGVIRGQTRDYASRPRVVLTNCLGVCPKEATAVAFAHPGEPPRVFSVRSESELEAAVAYVMPAI